MNLKKVSVLASAFLTVGSAVARAQVCVGSPTRGGVSYVNTRTTATKGNGGSLSFVPGRFAIGVSGKVIDSPPDQDGFGGALRLSLVLGKKLKVCPTLGAGVDRLTWDTQSDAKVTTDAATARGGIGIGYDIAAFRNFGIAPFIIGEFVERGYHFKTEAAENDPTDTGTWKGKAEGTYGVLAHYSRVFAGLSLSRRSAKGAPAERLIYGGFAF